MRPLVFLLPAALLMLSACSGKEPEDTSDPPDLTDDTGEDCNANAPVVTHVTIENGGILTFDNGQYPTAAIRMDLSDDDGDLDLVSMYVWFDDVVDGAVDQSGEAPIAIESYLFEDVAPCMKFTASLILKPEVSGGTLAYNTRYEWAVVGEDHHLVMSAPYITDGVTPKEDGSDGDAP